MHSAHVFIKHLSAGAIGVGSAVLMEYKIDERVTCESGFGEGRIYQKELTM